ncbi:YxiJ family protein [Robertmurraya kyonggiensis]|uniref:Uncharacterized protein n=1 Tax=Robertmurraya kyonggiensis TaxID=1037680 RepID=A0A4U1D9P6_9BACI|nr:YxiJ family protein [Robertmurraya kyonggiensis]TKC19222.1 hypothetical protein FA727_06685 [Robertmurraya kyonggiensis]
MKQYSKEERRLKMNPILQKLNSIKPNLEKPFPYTDSYKIQYDFRNEFLNLSAEKNCLNADFNTYCMNIAGTLSYVLKGKIDTIPDRQIQILQMSFFDVFNQYKFIENKYTRYKEYSEAYQNYEEARKLLLLLVRE